MVAQRKPFRRWLKMRRLLAADAGMTTAEYAVGTIAACAFAALLYAVITSGTVRGLIQSTIESAFSAIGG